MGGNWTPEQRAVLIGTLDARVADMKTDAELVAMCDWMIRACGLEPTDQLYRLALLVAIITTANDQ